MHFPQMPDPCGWDLSFRAFDTNEVMELADDWQCTETGPVSDIHFWFSWLDDVVGDINQLTVRIYSDDPCGPSGWSEPGFGVRRR